MDMGTSSAKKEALEEFKATHDEYVRALCEYLSPDERKPLLEETLTKFKNYFDGAQVDSVSAQDIKKYTASVKEASNNIIYPKGTCSLECIAILLRTKDLVLSSAMVSEKNGEKNQRAIIAISLMELSTSIVTEAIAKMLVLANSPKATWEVRDEVHSSLIAAQELLQRLAQSAKEGSVKAFNLPSVDPTKYKEFLN